MPLARRGVGGAESEIDLAELAGPALISVDPFFDSRPAKLIQLAARYMLPTA